MAKEHPLLWNSVITQNINIYRYNNDTESTFSIATKYEKTNMAAI